MFLKFILNNKYDIIITIKKKEFNLFIVTEYFDKIINLINFKIDCIDLD